MTLSIISFTARGDRLAAGLAEKLRLAGHEACHTVGHGQPGFSLREWTEQGFEQSEGLIFVGAAGIAVRAVAPHLRGKVVDPAVVVLDEGGRFSVSLLSGHLGGANQLALLVSELTGAQPVITTATDTRGAFAVDSWARRQGCKVVNPEKIKAISGRILDGGTVNLRSMFPITGEPPPGVRITRDKLYDVLVTVRTRGRLDALRLVPPVAVVGIGCKKGTGPEAIERAFRAILAKGSLYGRAVCGAASIDRKAEEPGLLEFCQSHGWTLQTFTAAELAEARGNFTPSAFVQKVTGVDNVCERAAVLASGGRLYCKKQAGNGVTMALALKPYTMDWSW